VTRRWWSWILLLGQLVVGCHYPTTLGRPPAKARACDYATPRTRTTPDCPHLWRLHLRALLARDRVDRAVESYRRRGESEEDLAVLALSVLGWGLGHRDPAVRGAAIRAIRLADASDLEPEVAGHLADPDEVVRTWAAVALSRVRDGANALRRQLRSRSPDARIVAVREYGRLFGADALAVLSPLTSDPDPRVRAAVCVGLSSTKSPAAQPRLLGLARDPKGPVRAQALTALGVLGLPAGREQARQALDDPDPLARRAAARALGRFPTQQVVTDLRRVAQGEDLLTALVAAAILARTGEVQPLLNAIAKGLVDRRWAVRVAALEEAAQLKDRVAVQLARRALRDAEPLARLAAARALLAEERQVAVQTALALQPLSCGSLARGMERVCLQSARLLAEARHEGGLAALLRVARQAPGPTTRLAALQTALGLGAGRPAALAALRDPSPPVILAAATWLYANRR
jgi:bilin biosynthesis protein